MIINLNIRRRNALLNNLDGIIEQNGLIVSLDASKSNSYPGSGSLWSDLTLNGNDFTLFDNPNYINENGGVLSFDGVSDYAKSLDLPTDLLGDKNFSVGGWFKLNNDFNEGSPWGFGNAAPTNNINAFCTVTNEISVSLSNVNVFGTNLYYSSANYKYVVWTKSQGVFSRDNCAIFVNGVKYTGNDLTNKFGNQSTIPNITTNANNKISIGKVSTDASNSQFSSMNVGSFHIYNRVLTDAEVLQNFNNTKNKFG